MDWDNCFCPGRDRSFEVARAHGSPRGVDVHENRCGAHVANGPCSSYKGHRNRNHFISRLDIQTAQGKVERARATVQGDAMIDFAVGCEFRLEI